MSPQSILSNFERDLKKFFSQRIYNASLTFDHEANLINKQQKRLKAALPMELHEEVEKLSELYSLLLIRTEDYYYQQGFSDGVCFHLATIFSGGNKDEKHSS